MILGLRSSTTKFSGLDGGSSFVDAVSTLSNISSIDIRGHLGVIWEGNLPCDYLPTALHEAVHHEHARSVVGRALAAIHMRVRQLAISLSRRNHLVTSLPGHTIEDLVAWRERYECVATVLRTISEGLACLAQFDALPRRNEELISFPTNFASVVGARDVPELLRPLALQAWLTPARLSDQSLTEKETLYADGFHCRAGGYLPGYMFARRIWARWAMNDTRLESPDVFLALAGKIIFYDYNLVTLMLAPELAPREIAKRMIDRICDRADTYSSAEITRCYERILRYQHTMTSSSDGGDTEALDTSRALSMRKAIAEMTGAAIPKDIVEAAVPALLVNAPSDVTTGYKRLVDCVKAGQTPNEYLTDLDATQLNTAVWLRRGWFWLGSLKVALMRVGQEIFYTGSDGIAGRLPCLEGIEGDYFESGWLTCAYTPQHATVVVAAGSQQHVIAAAAHWRGDRGSFLNTMHLLAEQSALIQADDAVRELVEETWSEQVHDSDLGALRKASSDVLTTRIAQAQLSGRTQRAVRAFLRSTERNGLAGLADTELLRACAILSIAASSGMLPEGVAAALASQGYHLEEIVPRASQFLNPIGGECKIVGDRIRISI